MESTLGPIPIDNDVRRLLSGARSTPDPRAIAAVTMMLSSGLSLNVVRQLRWNCLDIKSQTLRTRSCKIGTEVVTITKLLVRQLLAIPRSGQTGRIFAKHSPESPSIDLLLRRTLISSGLSMYGWIDFVRWSRVQTPATRLSVATP
jgi:integrase